MEKSEADIMSPTPKELPAHYSYMDYLTWPEDERWELIDGVPSLAPRQRFIYVQRLWRSVNTTIAELVNVDEKYLEVILF